MVFLCVKEVQMRGFRRSIPQRHHHAMLPLPVLSMLPPFSMFPNGGEHSNHQFHILRISFKGKLFCYKCHALKNC